MRRTGGPRTGSWVSLWRFRAYLRPYALRFGSMVIFAGLGIGAAIVIPLVTKAVIDGPIADSDRRGLLRPGLLAIGLGVVEAVLMFLPPLDRVQGHHRGRDRHPARDLYAKLQRLPMQLPQPLAVRAAAVAGS